MKNKKEPKATISSTKDEREVQSSLIFQMINYYDEKVVEKAQTFKDINRKYMSLEKVKDIPYMSLFI